MPATRSLRSSHFAAGPEERSSRLSYRLDLGDVTPTLASAVSWIARDRGRFGLLVLCQT